MTENDLIRLLCDPILGIDYEMQTTPPEVEDEDIETDEEDTEEDVDVEEDDEDSSDDKD